MACLLYGLVQLAAVVEDKDDGLQPASAHLAPNRRERRILRQRRTPAGEQALATVVVVAFSFSVTWIIATIVPRTIGLRVAPADENDLDRAQQALSAYALGRPASGLQPAIGAAVRPAMPVAAAGGGMKLIRA